MTKQELIEAKIKQVKDGEKPTFIGLSLTDKQYEKLLPYIGDPDYQSIIQARAEV